MTDTNNPTPQPNAVQEEAARTELRAAQVEASISQGVRPAGKRFTIQAIDAAPQERSVACPCTLIEQDESCPVGYPSLLCGVCNGIGKTTTKQVTALACEMIKIASDIGEPEDPFAAWESIDLIRTERGHFYKQFQTAWAALTPVSENEKRGMERVLAILRSKQQDAVDEGNGFGPTWSARNKAFKECAEMLRLALEAENPSPETSEADADE